MGQRWYALAFLVVLIVALVGGFIGARLLINRIQADFGEPPATAALAAAPTGMPEATVASLRPATQPAAATAAPEPPKPIVSTPIAPTPEPFPTMPVEPLQGGDTETPESPAIAGPQATASPELTVETSATATEMITPAPVSGFAFAPAAQVRYSIGDCPGNYVLGRVNGPGGAPLAGIGLRLVDEFGNQALVRTKSEPADLGKYDFPVSGPARRFYLSVVDANGAPVSDAIEILFKLPPSPEATCHWVDWIRR
jgi:hypothetical protein